MAESGDYLVEQELGGYVEGQTHRSARTDRLPEFG